MKNQKGASKLKRRQHSSKVLGAILLVLIAAFILIAIPRPVLNLSDIDNITLVDALGNSTSVVEKTAISQFVEGLNSATPVQKDLVPVDLVLFQLNYKGVDRQWQYDLYVDKNLSNKGLYLDLGSDNSKKINSRYFDRILTDPIFDTLYQNNRPPSVSVVINNIQDIILPVLYEWQVKKVDQLYHPAKTDYLKGNEAYSFILKEDSKMGFDFETPPDSFHLDFYQDGILVGGTDKNDNATDLLNSDGLYQGVLTLEWDKCDNRDFYGKAGYEFEVTVDFPVQFEISASEIDPGELVVIKANNIYPEDDLTIKTDIDFKPNAFQNGSTRVILLPVSYFHKEDKTYDIKVSSGSIEQDFKVRVRPKEFTTQYLTIDTQVAAATRNEKSSAQMQDKVYPLKPISDPVQYWEGAFIQPVEGGRVKPADFGKKRYVNNAPTSYRHNGLDIGQDEGTPVQATNNGRILIAEYLIETGNTIIIEHGYGLKSWYFHMSELKVKTGDIVKKGDVIGLVGSTGFSTAPHLHFSFTVNNIWINPITILEQGVPFTGED